MNILYRIVLPYGVFGVIIKNNIVVEIAPIGKWMKGKHIDKISNWVKQRKGKLELVK